MASEKVKVLNHPPYSPDLSPCDFFSFPRLKKMLSGNKYTSRSYLGSAIYQVPCPSGHTVTGRFQNSVLKKVKEFYNKK